MGLDLLPTHVFTSLPQPQLIGIAAGCSVFVATILTVGVLLVQGGSIERLKKELNGEAPPPPPTRTQPRLVDELLAAAASLPAAPALGAAAVAAARDGDARRVAVDVRRATGGDDAALALAADGAARYGHGPYRAGDVWFDGAPDPRAWRASAGADGEALTIGDVVGGARRVVGALRLLRNRPRDLVVGIALDWLHPAYAPGGEDAPRTADLALYAAVDALFAAGYRRVDCLLPAQDLGRRRVFERCGFALEGVLKKYWVADERSRDAAAYALLNTDWTGGLKRRRAGALGVDPPPTPPK